MKRYLADYSLMCGELAVQRQRKPGEYLITGYNNGFVNRSSIEFPDEWLRRATKENPRQFRLDSVKP